MKVFGISIFLVVGLVSIPHANDRFIDRIISDESKVRSTAQKEFSNLKDKEKLKVLPDLIELLTNGNSDTQLRILAVLKNMGPIAKDAIPALSTALKNDDVWVRSYGAEALGNMGDKAKMAVPALAKALDRRGQEKCWIISALDKIGPAAEHAIPVLISYLEDNEPCGNSPGSYRAADALIKIGKPALPYLQKISDHSDEEVNGAVRYAIKTIKNN